jgi:hypothetical protein
VHYFHNAHFSKGHTEKAPNLLAFSNSIRTNFPTMESPCSLYNLQVPAASVIIGSWIITTCSRDATSINAAMPRTHINYAQIPGNLPKKDIMIKYPLNSSIIDPAGLDYTQLNNYSGNAFEETKFPPVLERLPDLRLADRLGVRKTENVHLFELVGIIRVFRSCIVGTAVFRRNACCKPGPRACYNENHQGT